MRRSSLVVGLLLLAGCGFNPDLSRFPPCDGAGKCPAGSLCLAEAQRCVPECGEDCAPPQDAGSDAGAVDAGTDAGTDAGQDAGVDAGEDAGTLDAGPVLTLAAATLPPAIETKPWAHTFVPTGGEPMYFFSIDGGPPSFTLSAGGQLATAAATTAGTFPFSITVQDSATPRAQVTTPFSLQVRPFLRVASNVLVEGRQGQPYSQQLSATGGQPPYTWGLDGGMPPTGTSLDSSGLIQGNANQLNTVSFGVSVRDSATPPQQANRTVSVNTTVLDTVLLSIATKGVADGRVGTPYDQPLKAYGGTNAYTWTVDTGTASLPPGLMLTNAGSTYALSGTPTTAGSYPFTLRCRDGAVGNLTVMLTLTVY